MSGRFDQKRNKGGPEADGAEVDQEEAQQQQQQQEESKDKKQDQQQNTVGNAAIAAMLAGRGEQLDREGAETEMAAMRAKDELKIVQHGGDDDGGDVPLTLEDLTRSWNPGIRKTKDRGRFTEYMPDDTLPPEDEDYLVELRSVVDPIPLDVEVPPLDALIQPSEAVVASSLGAWAREATRWAGTELHLRALSKLLHHPPAWLQDPFGRVLLGRTRVGAMGAWMLVESPALRGIGPADSALVGYSLELAGRRARTINLRWEVEQSEEKLPFAAKLFEEWAPEPGSRVRPRALAEAPSRALAATLATLLDFEDPTHFVPDLSLPEGKSDDDDPLGLDTIMQSFTGGVEDEVAVVYRAAIRGAERLATAAARTRIQFAATSVVLAEASVMWSTGSPVHELRHALQLLDKEVQSNLKLLVEIARAAQKRTVALPGIKNGLLRAARTLAQVRARGTVRLVQVVGAVLPGSPSIGAPPLPAADTLTEAWSDGDPAQAIPWLQSLPASLHRDAAVAFTRLASAPSVYEVLPPLRELYARASQQEPHLGAAVGTALGSCLLWDGLTDEALELSRHQLELGRRRRNGLAVADASLLAIEAHLAREDEDALRAERLRCGNLLWRMGARGPLSLLARWTPPEDEFD